MYLTFAAITLPKQFVVMSKTEIDLKPVGKSEILSNIDDPYRNFWAIQSKGMFYLVK